MSALPEPILNGSYKKCPLLSDLSLDDALFINEAAAEVMNGNLDAALDVIIKQSEDEIPDVHAESFLRFAQNLCASMDHADGWILFRKELARFLIESRRQPEAKQIIADLMSVIHDDYELKKLRDDVIQSERSELLEKRSKESADPGFVRLMKRITEKSENDIFELIMDNFSNQSDNYKRYLAHHFTQYPFWGALDLNNGKYDVFSDRARELYKHSNDYIDLHNRLFDARSKNVLYSILAN